MSLFPLRFSFLPPRLKGLRVIKHKSAFAVWINCFFKRAHSQFSSQCPQALSKVTQTLGTRLPLILNFIAFRCTCAFTLVKSHTSAGSAPELSLNPGTLLRMSESTPVKSHINVRRVENALPSPPLTRTTCILIIKEDRMKSFPLIALFTSGFRKPEMKKSRWENHPLLSIESYFELLFRQEIALDSIFWLLPLKHDGLY